MIYKHPEADVALTPDDAPPSEHDDTNYVPAETADEDRVTRLAAWLHAHWFELPLDDIGNATAASREAAAILLDAIAQLDAS